MYKTFDLFIEQLKLCPDVAHQLSEAEKKSRASADGKFLCSVPLGPKDRTSCEDKDNKYYFQFTQKYAQALKASCPHLFLHHPILNKFFNKLQTVHQAREHAFDQVLSQLQTQDPVLETMMRKKGKLVIVLKILAYYGKDNSGTSPHYDKSGLSLTLDNDDQGSESFVLCPYRARFDSSKLAPVTRAYKKILASLLQY